VPPRSGLPRPDAAAVAEVTPAAVDRADHAAEAATDDTAAADAAADATTTAATTDDAATDVADDDAVVTPLAATPQAQGDGRRLAVRASVGAAAAGADDLVFRIELSRPAEQTVVLIYGTVDGTAVAGKDYEPQQGVVTLARGSKSAEVHVPLIKNRRAREDARFELFLTADPKVAEVVDQRISATVPAAN
jgi:Calx-beta domain